ncbi:thioesterase family protein [Planotetraspora sp. A-T 1434]|uniref:acyl-CoA thioesterase n=1 Tax=Planotetraspora sp. A-T 1434 TaxID=2979219 RepID=UPI0021BE6518|nr:thioesterase family protein [Planotetraspora sp. A-T 1434]MCT9933312.1 thioesterase family protein [Planotetraspora sp. A-T 1434]
MADLGLDTDVEQLDDLRFRAVLSEDWNVWGPIGGYLASVALRAAGRASGMARPASISCDFLNVARFEEVGIEVTRLRSSRRTEALRVSMTQRDRAVLDATVWAAAGDLAGPDERLAAAPEVPEPERVPTIEERAAEWGQMSFPQLANCETRPISWFEGMPGGFGEVNMRGWMRLRPRPVFPGDLWLDACRALLHIDTSAFPAVLLACPPGVPFFVAPTMQLQVSFHDAAPEAEWLLVEGYGMSVRHGLAAGRAAVWSPDGRLIATGAQQMLCRVVETEQFGESAPPTNARS